MKTVLILHGWPQPVEPGSVNYPYKKYFEKKGCLVLAPNLFAQDFVLKEPDAKNHIKSLLGGKKPAVIVGISLGGLLAPHIAKDYPKAKMILIATDPKMQPGVLGFRTLFYLAGHSSFLKLIGLVRFLPSSVLYAFYRIADPFSGVEADRVTYNNHMRNNIKYMMTIPVSKEKQIVDFVGSTDNTKLLKTLRNTTLIFSGRQDILMPDQKVVSLQSLLVNSRLIETDGGHFNVFTDKNFADIDKFLDI